MLCVKLKPRLHWRCDATLSPLSLYYCTGRDGSTTRRHLHHDDIMMTMTSKTRQNGPSTEMSKGHFFHRIPTRDVLGCELHTQGSHSLSFTFPRHASQQRKSSVSSHLRKSCQFSIESAGGAGEHSPQTLVRLILPTAPSREQPVVFLCCCLRRLPFEETNREQIPIKIMG